MGDDSNLTVLIQLAQQGDKAARDKLYELVYAELRLEAERLIRGKGPEASASSLVHEGYLKFFHDRKLLDVSSRRYFYFAATRKMRDILVERIRKRERRPPSTPVDELADRFLEDFRRETRWEFLAVHNALDRFTRSRNARKRRRHELIELIYFGELSMKEAAETLEISYSQAGEDKRLALAELAVELEKREP